MPSNDDSWHRICLDNTAAVTSVGFPFLEWFHSACIISFIENIYVYMPFLLYFHHPPLKIVNMVSGKSNMFTLGIPKRIYISAHHGHA